MSEFERNESAERQESVTPKSSRSELWEWTKALAIAVILVVLIRSFIFSPFVVSGPSMLPNFHDRERLIVNKMIYFLRDPKRGEVIVFHAPEGKDYIKRVIALPGERVRVEGDQVYVNDQLLDEGYIREAVDEAARRGTTYNVKNYAERTVPEDTVFVMGDNRPNSKDSRDIGFISLDEIVGRADIIYWPIPNWTIVKHSVEVKP